MSVLVDHTPVERHLVNGRKVYVKREDLSTRPPAPALAKLRGVKRYLEKLRETEFEKARPKGAPIQVGVFDTKISKAGWGVAALVAGEPGMADFEVTNYYMDLKAYGGVVPPNQQKVLDLGHHVVGVPGGKSEPMFFHCRNRVKDSGGYMLPYGLVVEESVWATRDVANQVAKERQYGDVVVCCGSGMITAGLVEGLAGKISGTIIAVSAGMNLARQAKRIDQVLDRESWRLVVLHVLPKGVTYYQCEPVDDIPFPTSPYYDAKAWRWLVRNVRTLRPPVLFWNIGT